MKRTLDDSETESLENEKRARNSSPSNDRFFILSAADGSDLSTINPFLLGKAVKLQAGSVAELRKLRNGTVLVKTADSKQASAIQKMERIGETRIKVEVHRSLNHCKGVVRSKELSFCTNEEIIDELKSQGVVGCSNISVKSDSGERRKTNTYILTFHTTVPPKHVYISDYLRIPVAVYIPNPLRCFKCQKFGHSQNNCKGQKVCARCATPGHDATDCTSPHKCTNCSGDHSAFSKECPSWIKEKNIQQIRAEKGVSFLEARKMVQSQAGAKAGRSFATAAASARDKSQSTKCTSTAVQTDLTWPNSQKEPTYVITFEKSVQTDGLSPSASRAGIRQMQPTHSADPRDATTPPRPQRRREQSASGSGAVSSAGLAARREPGRQGDVAQMRTSSLSPDKKSKEKKGPMLHRPPKKLGEDPVKIHNKYGALDDHDLEQTANHHAV